MFRKRQIKLEMENKICWFMWVIPNWLQGQVFKARRKSVQVANKGHMYKQWYLFQSQPQMCHVPTPGNPRSAHSTLKMTLQVTWYPAGATGRASVPAPVPASSAVVCEGCRRCPEISVFQLFICGMEGATEIPQRLKVIRATLAESDSLFPRTL